MILPTNICLDVQIDLIVTLNISPVTLSNPNISNVNTIIITYATIGMILTNTTDSLINKSVSYTTFK